MADNQGLAVAKCNFVANDEIWWEKSAIINNKFNNK